METAGSIADGHRDAIAVGIIAGGEVVGTITTITDTGGFHGASAGGWHVFALE